MDETNLTRNLAGIDYKDLNQQIGNIDLYLLDQILKGRFEGRKRILDAGCGEGRNLKYFINNSCEVHGVDSNAMAIKMLQMTYKDQKENFKAGSIEQLEFDDDYFGVIICTAVLHFANNEEHFLSMMKAMVRALKPTGILFIRMACEIGLNSNDNVGNHGFTFLLSEAMLERIQKEFNLKLLEPFKTVLVEDKRSMAVLVLEKEV